MTLASTASGAGRSPLRHLPVLAALLAAAAVVLLALGPIGWRAGWWHFRFAFQTLMPWAATSDSSASFSSRRLPATLALRSFSLASVRTADTATGAAATAA